MVCCHHGGASMRHWSGRASCNRAILMRPQSGSCVMARRCGHHGFPRWCREYGLRGCFGMGVCWPWSDIRFWLILQCLWTRLGFPFKCLPNLLSSSQSCILGFAMLGLNSLQLYRMSGLSAARSFALATSDLYFVASADPSYSLTMSSSSVNLSSTTRATKRFCIPKTQHIDYELSVPGINFVADLVLSLVLLPRQISVQYFHLIVIPVIRS